jgi:hypothetical protein
MSLVQIAFSLPAFACGSGSPGLTSRTDVLGHSQPSLRDLSAMSIVPGTMSWGHLDANADKRSTNVDELYWKIQWAPPV